MLSTFLGQSKRLSSLAKATLVGARSLSSSPSSLPHVPLPSVEDTCERYLSSVAPLLSPIEMDTTKDIVEAFVSDENTKKLQEKLQELDRLDGSFIKGFWDDMYLNGRWALPINSNPFLVFSPFKAEGQLEVASALTISSLKFALKQRSGKLETTLVKNTPLCMSQFEKMFSCTRLPVKGRDELRSYGPSRHIVVLVNGDFYSVEVVSKDGMIRSEESLKALFDEMIKRTLTEISEERGLGVFTTLDRDHWAKIRSELVKDEVNQKSLEEIDSAIFLVSLDADEPAESLKALSTSFLHGKVSASVPLNRWFDKTISLLIDSQGSAAVNFEHCWGDGVPVARFMQEVHSDLIGSNSGYAPLKAEAAPQGHLPQGFKKLMWNLSPSLKEEVGKATIAYEGQCNNVDLEILDHDAFGIEACKKAGLSPDGVIQMAIQLAYYNLYGRVVSTYESCNVQHFHLGRTETIRSTTSDALSLVQRFEKTNNQERFELLRRAAKTHAKISENARTGKGVDRHLYALSCISLKLGLPTPEIFRDPAYLKFTSNTLSTSTVSAPFVRLAGFGSPTPGGYGIGYESSKGSSMAFCVTSYKDHPGTNSSEFVQSLSQVFRKIQLCFPEAN